MTWKQHLENKGFHWNNINESMIKPLSFGNKIEVTMYMKGLFEISKNGKIVFSHYIESFNEFKEIADNIIGN